MIIQERLLPNVAIIHMSGRVTLIDGTAALTDMLHRLIQQDGRTNILIDFGDVPYIDSTALGTILRAHASVKRRGGALKMVRVGGHVRQLFEVTRLWPIFEIFDSEAEAVASFTPTVH